MNIASTAHRAQVKNTAPQAQAQTAPAQEEAKPSAADIFSQGASNGADYANFAMGAYGAGSAGVMVGAGVGTAISLGGDIIGAVKSAIEGDFSTSVGEVLKGALKTGAYAAGGAVAGGVGLGLIGGFTARGAGKIMGNIGAKTASKFGGSEDVGRAVGTLGTGIAMGAFAGAGVAGWNGAIIAAGAGAVGGGLAYINS